MENTIELLKGAAALLDVVAAKRLCVLGDDQSAKVCFSCAEKIRQEINALKAA